jgi:hypothetical protein
MDKRRRKTEETKFMRRTAEYRLLYRRGNEDVLEEYNVDAIEKKLAQKNMFKSHFSSTEDIKCPKQQLEY